MWMEKKQAEKGFCAQKRPRLWYLARASGRGRRREQEWEGEVVTGKLCAKVGTKETRAGAEV